MRLDNKHRVLMVYSDRSLEKIRLQILTSNSMPLNMKSTEMFLWCLCWFQTKFCTVSMVMANTENGLRPIVRICIPIDIRLHCEVNTADDKSVNGPITTALTSLPLSAWPVMVHLAFVRIVWFSLQFVVELAPRLRQPGASGFCGRHFPQSFCSRRICID